MPPLRKVKGGTVKGGTEGTPKKKATRTSSRKASSTNDRKEKTDDATKSSVPPGAIPYNPNDVDDEYEYVPLNLAPNQQDVSVSLSPLETLVEGVKRFSRRIYEGSPEQLRNVTSKKSVGVTEIL